MAISRILALNDPIPRRKKPAAEAKYTREASDVTSSPFVTSSRRPIRTRLQRGFTLIELMIVIAIIGILASLAIPAYSDYLARSQMAEALELMGATKVPLEEYFVDRGTWPSSIGSVVNTVSGKYTATIAGAPGGTTSTYIITATMRSTGISSVLAGRTAQFLTIDAARTWNCQVGGPAPVEDQYLPSVCR